MIMVLSPHISSNNSDSYLINNNNGAVQLQLDQILQYTSHQFTNNPLAYGSIMGGTAMLVPLMRFISASFGGIAQCVANRGTKYMHRMHDMHMMHGNVTSNNSAASHYFDSYGVCGASGPVHFVSFLSSILSWVYLAIAVVLYTRRNELLEGSGGGGGIGGGSYQYDEIGESQNDVRSSGFAGDFPNGGVATTMQV
ncbi:hypothetical protein ACHAWO_005665 [Cyclotella atomus]|uniref:Uncharacterized protein n=1 Tax=Cyclotella atomus TaxID=382360 RepID=A0ABD3QQQ1_9STRA